jgi:hypothetical protein
MRKIPILTTPTEEQSAIALATVVSVAEAGYENPSLYFAAHVVSLTDALEYERQQNVQLRALLSHSLDGYWIVEQVNERGSCFLSLLHGDWYFGLLESYAVRFTRENDAEEVANLHSEAQAVYRPKGKASHVN